MTTQLQPPPHNLEAEAALLGSLLIAPGPAALLQAQDAGLMPDDFYMAKHNWIYDAILALSEAGSPYDIVTLPDELERRGQLEEIGGVAYLALLMKDTPTAVHIEPYAQIVHGTARRRALIAVAGDVARLAWDGEQGVDEVMGAAEGAMFAVTQESKGRGGLQHIMPDLHDLYDHINTIRDGKLPGVPTGFKDLDNLLGGLHKGDQVILAGRPGMGKTAMLTSIALNAAWTGRRVALFSLEMSRREMTQRLVAAQSGIGTHVLRTGRLDGLWPAFVEASGDLGNLKIHIDDTPGISPAQLRGQCLRLAMEQGVDLILVDYLQLMTTGKRIDGGRHHELGFITKALKNLARELDVPLVAGSQLNRGVESRADKRPLLSDLRDSGAIEEDADIVLFIYRDEMYDPETEMKNIAELICAKHRQGPTGMINLFFQKQQVKFIDAQVFERELNI